MFANVRVFRAGFPATAAGSLSQQARIQWCLAIVLIANVGLVAASFAIEDALTPWRMRMDSTTPGWCFALAGASAVGLVTALMASGGWLAVVESLLAATLLGYAYFFTGAVLIDMGRTLQHAHLVFRGVELGMVSMAAMMLGITLRLVLRQRLTFDCGAARRGAAQYQLGELMFLTVVFAAGLGLVNVFFDHYRRETQLADILFSVVRAFPAALPWLWGVTRPKLAALELALIVGGSIGVMMIKAAISAATTSDEFGDVLLLAGQRAAAYATSATINGLLLRSLGLRWHAV
jgi:hypothetical protein